MSIDDPWGDKHLSAVFAYKPHHGSSSVKFFETKKGRIFPGIKLEVGGSEMGLQSQSDRCSSGIPLQAEKNLTDPWSQVVGCGDSVQYNRTRRAG